MVYDFDLFEIEGNTLVKYIGGDQEVVQVPEGIEIIGEEAFSCLGVEIEDIILPSSVKHIRKSAFDSSGIYRINLPEGLISIGDSAFVETNLADVWIPSTLVRLGNSVFTSTLLDYIYVSPDNPYFALRGHTLYDIIDRKIIVGFGNYHIKGDDVECIGDDAFYGLTLPSDFTIPEGVKTIGANSFSFCEGIEEIKLPSSLIHIGDSAFSCCKSLKTIRIPEKVTTIPNQAFYCCSALENVYIPEGVTTIESGAFHSCKNIKSIRIPSSVRIIGQRAFCDNNQLATIYCELSEKPSGWSKDWNDNKEWDDTFLGHHIHGGINTQIVWGASSFNECSDSFYGLDLSFDNAHISIELENALFYCDLEECDLMFSVTNKTNTSIRVWLNKISIFNEIDEDDEIEGYKLLVEVGAYETTKIIYSLKDSFFERLYLTPACMDDNPYDSECCCSSIFFDVAYDFGAEDIGRSSWMLCDYEISTIGSYEKIIKEIEDNNPQFTTGNILYIYKGNIRCHRYGHHIIQATAILHNKTDNEVQLNVEYCTECKKFILEYTVFEEYRRRYGVLVGNFRMMVNGEFESDYELADESPLMLSGYNVSQKDGYTSRERHYILARIIHDRIMDKGDVIRYLSYFIRKNGAKRGNETALSKWREDLEFVQGYDMNIQPSTIISDIKRY